MLFYLFSADELRQLFGRLGYPFEEDTIPRNIEYYMARTSHGSTLSKVVHAWVWSARIASGHGSCSPRRWRATSSISRGDHAGGRAPRRHGRNG